MDSYVTATRVAVMNMVINWLLAAGKCTVGWLTHSSALVSDGVHSMADALSSVAVIVGVKLSSKQADAGHPYGCERLECVAAIVLSVVVAVGGCGIAAVSIKTMGSMNMAESAPLGYAWITAVVAMAIKEGMFRYTRCAAERCGSAALMADAWHQRTDALSSLSSFVGVIGARIGVTILDPLAGVAIALLILKTAYDIFVDATRKMVDHACDPNLQQQIDQYVVQMPDVIAVHEMRTRLFSNRVLVELTVQIGNGHTAEYAYAIAKAVGDSVEEQFEEVKRCSVHIHPSEIPFEPLQNL